MTSTQNPFETVTPPFVSCRAAGPGEHFSRHRGLVEVLARSDEGARDGKAEIEGWDNKAPRES